MVDPLDHTLHGDRIGLRDDGFFRDRSAHASCIERSFGEASKDAPNLFVGRIGLVIAQPSFDLGDLLGSKVNVGVLKLEKLKKQFSCLALAFLRQRLHLRDRVIEMRVHGAHS
jgi:hypothetical protein